MSAGRRAHSPDRRRPGPTRAPDCSGRRLLRVLTGLVDGSVHRCHSPRDREIGGGGGVQAREGVVPERSGLNGIVRGAVVVGLLVFGCFCLMLTLGAASFIHECHTVTCGQLHQAVFAAVAGSAVFLAAYRLVTRRPHAALITFGGTVPILVVHVLLEATDPNEAMFFPLSTTPVPTVAAAVLLHQAFRTRAASPAEAGSGRGRR